MSYDALIAVLVEARKLLARGDNDYAWSSWGDSDAACAEIDSLMFALRRGELPQLTLQVIFAPTGPMQEVSLSSGWGCEFIALAKRFDHALAEILGPDAAS